jgi:hypothetical protein
LLTYKHLPRSSAQFNANERIANVPINALVDSVDSDLTSALDRAVVEVGEAAVAILAAGS